MTDKLTPFLAFLVLILLLADRAGAHGLDQEVENLSDDEVGVYVDDEPYTVGELKILLTVREAPYRRSEYIFFGIADLANMGYQDPVYRTLAVEARREGYSLDEEEKAKIDAKARDMARNVLYRREILEGIPYPEPGVLEELYEEVKDGVLRMDERWIMREIHLPITDPDFEETAPRIIRETWNRLEEGESFLSLMDEVNPPGTRNTARIIHPESDTELTDEVREAFLSIENRQYSEPFRSPRGYHIVYRQMRIPADYIPFESAREYLLEEHRNRLRNQRVEDFFRPMVMDRNLVQPHLANLQSRGYLALDDDIAVRVGGRAIYRRELAAAIGWKFSPEVTHGETRFRELALHMGPIQEALLDIMVEEENILDSPDIVYYREAAETTLLVRKYLRSRYFPEDLTREEIGGFFRANRETFPTMPLVWGFREMASVPGMDTGSLIESGADYSAVEDYFEGLAAIDNIVVVPGERETWDGISLINFGEEDRERILRLATEGGVSLEIERELADILVVERVEGVNYPLEVDEVKVRELLKIEKFHWFVDETIRQLAHQAGHTLEAVFPM